jgi:hypothetical protein
MIDNRKAIRRPPNDISARCPHVDSGCDLGDAALEPGAVIEQHMDSAGPRLVHPGLRQAIAIRVPPFGAALGDVDVEHAVAGGRARRDADEHAGVARPERRKPMRGQRRILEPVRARRTLEFVAGEARIGELHCRAQRLAFCVGHSSAPSANGRTAALNLSAIERSANSSKGL